MKIRLLLASIFVLLSMPSLAAEQTITLSVPGMDCAACPITVKAALEKVEGVTQVEVTYPEREAEITLEDTQTSVKELTQATTQAGYPSTLKSSGTDQDDHKEP